MLQPHRPRANAAALFIIRIALVFPVLVFGAITYFRFSQGAAPATGPDETLTWIVLGAWVAITAGILVLSRRSRDTASRDQRVTFAVFGWALGEAAAFLGATHYFLTGDPRRYGIGLLIFVIALVMFPIPRDQPDRDEGPRLMR